MFNPDTIKQLLTGLPNFVMLNTTRAAYLVLGVAYLNHSLSAQMDDTIAGPLNEMAATHMTIVSRLEALEQAKLNEDYYLLRRYKEKITKDPSDIKYSNILMSHNSCRVHNNYVDSAMPLDSREFMHSICMLLAEKVRASYKEGDYSNLVRK